MLLPIPQRPGHLLPHLSRSTRTEATHHGDNMSGLNGLETRVHSWADNVNLPANPRKQLDKLQEEVRELEQAMSDGNLKDVENELGDVQVTVFALTRALDTRSEHVTAPRVVTIEDRARRGGRVVDGQYVKPEDLNDDEEADDDA